MKKLSLTFNYPDEVKEMVFKLWEKDFEININGVLIEREKMDMAYDIEDEMFEFYNAHNNSNEPLFYLPVYCIKTINNITIIKEWLQ